MANTTTNTQNNIDIYNKNKIAELKAVHKFLNSVFGTPTASATTNTSFAARAAAGDKALSNSHAVRTNQNSVGRYHR